MNELPKTPRHPSFAHILLSGAVLTAGCSSPNMTAPSAADDSGMGSITPPSGNDAGPMPMQPMSDAGSSSVPDSPTSSADSPASSGDSAPLSQCVPAIPELPWTSPYAGWSRGIPSDPSFFPISVWLQGSWHATEIAAAGINIFVGNNAGTDPMAASDLATLKGLGLHAIIGQDSVGLANIDDPTIVGWWMDPDEPDNAQPISGGGYGPPVAPATLVTQYNAYKAADATRPIYVGLGMGVAYDNWEGRGSNAPPESGYVPASDIVDFDIYPYNNCGGDANEMATCGQFWLNAFGVDRLHMWSNRKQAVWTDIETTIIGAGTSTGPTPVQTASEVWLALIHSANGITYFIDTWNPTFREDGVFADSTMVTSLTALNLQIKELAPELNSASIPDLVSVMSGASGTTIDTMVKANGTSLYVFSAISSAGTTTGNYTIHGLTGNGTATVVGESRTVAITSGAFSDDFAANGVHIYQIDFSKITCP